MCRNVMCSMGRARLAGLVVCMAVASTASAGMIAYDGFSYADGTNLNGASGGTGWSNNWSLTSTGGSVTGVIWRPSLFATGRLARPAAVVSELT